MIDDFDCWVLKVRDAQLCAILLTRSLLLAMMSTTPLLAFATAPLNVPRVGYGSLHLLLSRDWLATLRIGRRHTAPHILDDLFALF
jgi:hypothetical protein